MRRAQVVLVSRFLVNLREVSTVGLASATDLSRFSVPALRFTTRLRQNSYDLEERVDHGEARHDEYTVAPSPDSVHKSPEEAMDMARPHRLILNI